MSFKHRVNLTLRESRIQYGNFVICACGKHVDLHDDLVFAQMSERKFDVMLERLYHNVDIDQSADLSQKEYSCFLRKFYEKAEWKVDRKVELNDFLKMHEYKVVQETQDYYDDSSEEDELPETA